MPSEAETLREAGYSPHNPILLVPGYMSSALVVEESPYSDWVQRRVWIRMRSMGFEKMFTDALPVLKSLSAGVKAERQNKDTNLPADEVMLMRKWISHMVLEKDGITDPEGIKVRAVPGIKGVAYLDPGRITSELSWVFGPLIVNLKQLGYNDTNLQAASYDWRLPPHMLEERDGHFSNMLRMIEQLYNNNNSTKVVLVVHSLGNRVVHYFLRWVQARNGREWIDKYIDTWIAVGPLWLGAPKSLRGMLSGEMMGLEPFIFTHEGLALSRSNGSTPWMMPIPSPYYNLDDFTHIRKDGPGAEYETKGIIETLDECELSRIKAYYQDYYLSNPFFGPLDSMLKAPPINKLLCVYGINLKTEVGYYYKRQPDDRLVPLQLDPEANPSFPGHETEGGIVYEVSTTPQRILGDAPASGDGTVPYASMSFCSTWQEQGVDVKIRELEGVDHRAILRDPRFLRIVLQHCCVPSLQSLPAESFSVISFTVTKQMRGRKAPTRTLVLTLSGIENRRPETDEASSFHSYKQVKRVTVDTGRLTIEYYNSHPYTYCCTDPLPIAQALLARCSIFSKPPKETAEELRGLASSASPQILRHPEISRRQLRKTVTASELPASAIAMLQDSAPVTSDEQAQAQQKASAQVYATQQVISFQEWTFDPPEDPAPAPPEPALSSPRGQGDALQSRIVIQRCSNELIPTPSPMHDSRAYDNEAELLELHNPSGIRHQLDGGNGGSFPPPPCDAPPQPPVHSGSDSALLEASLVYSTADEHQTPPPPPSVLHSRSRSVSPPSLLPPPEDPAPPPPSMSGTSTIQDSAEVTVTPPEDERS